MFVQAFPKRVHVFALNYNLFIRKGRSSLGEDSFWFMILVYLMPKKCNACITYAGKTNRHTQNKVAHKFIGVSYQNWSILKQDDHELFIISRLECLNNWHIINIVSIGSKFFDFFWSHQVPKASSFHDNKDHTYWQDIWF